MTAASAEPKEQDKQQHDDVEQQVGVGVGVGGEKKASSAAASAADAAPSSSPSTSPKSMMGDILAGPNDDPNHDYYMPRKATMSKCPHCGFEGTTRAEGQIGTWTIVNTVALLILFWPLSWVALVLGASCGCQQVNHTCAKCSKPIGGFYPWRGHNPPPGQRNERNNKI